MADPGTKSKFKEGKWKCTAEGTYSDTICGHINPGPAKLCEQCHSHRPKDVKFFLDADTEEIIDAERLADAKQQPDWKCYHCNYDNDFEEFSCKHCGKLRDTEEEKWLGFDQNLKKKAYNPEEKIDSSQTSQENKKSTISRYLKKGGIALGAIILVVFLYRMFFATTEYEVTVTGFSWDREVLIEEMKMEREEGWDYPSGAKIIRKKKRQNGTEQVYSHSEWVEEPIYEEVKVGQHYVDCGTIDNGNGYFEEKQCLEDIYENQQVGTERVEQEMYVDEPVYDTWYTYDVERWTFSYAENASGLDKNPYWPKYKEKRKERVQEKVEVYTIELKSNDPNNKYPRLNYKTDQGEWNRIKLNDHYIADVKPSGTVTQLKPIK